MIAERAVQAVVSRVDSWVNAMTGLGTLRDKIMHTQVVPGSKLSDATLEALYNDDDLAQRIVSKVPREATRRGFVLNLEGTEQDDSAETAREIMDAFKLLRAGPKLREAWIWGRLYAGGAVFVGADDGQLPDQPLNEATIRQVQWLNVLKRPQLTIERRYTDVNADKYGEPELYRINAPTNWSGGALQKTETLIHESRLILFEGSLSARTTSHSVDGWEDSVLQMAHDAIRQTTTSFQSVANLVSDASQGVLKIDGLIDMIAAKGEEALRTRISMMDLCRSVCRSILLDAEREDFTRVATSFAGIPEVMDRQMMRVASCSEMPVTILFGRSPAGLNATGESDVRGWYDTVNDAQTDVLLPRLERLLRIMMLAKDSPTRGKLPERWSVEFNPLWQPTEKERAEVLKIKAETHVALVGASIMMETESALALAQDFPTIDTEHRQELLEADIDAGARPGETGPEEDEPPNDDPGEGGSEGDGPKGRSDAAAAARAKGYLTQPRHPKGTPTGGQWGGGSGAGGAAVGGGGAASAAAVVGGGGGGGAAAAPAGGAGDSGPLQVDSPDEVRRKVARAAHSSRAEGHARVQAALEDVDADVAEEATEWASQWVYDSSAELASEAISGLKEPGSWAQHQYEATQAVMREQLPSLQAKGIVDKDGYVKLYRGVKGPQAEKVRAALDAGGGEAVMDVRGVASWSESYGRALHFADGNSHGVVEQRVHYTRAFATHRGQSRSTWQRASDGGEQEWAVIAQSQQMRVSRATAP